MASPVHCTCFNDDNNNQYKLHCRRWLLYAGSEYSLWIQSSLGQELHIAKLWLNLDTNLTRHPMWWGCQEDNVPHIISLILDISVATNIQALIYNAFCTGFMKLWCECETLPLCSILPSWEQLRASPSATSIPYTLQHTIQLHTIP